MKQFVAYIAICLLALMPESVWAVRSRLFIADRQGLSSTYVNSVMQDSRGFIWIATRGGLDRYDGGRFVSWHNGVLPSDNVTCLAEDGDGRLVAGTVRGAAIYDYVGSRFTPVVTINGNDTVQVHVTSLLRMADGDVLMATAGYGLFRLPRGKSVATTADITFKGAGSVRHAASTPDNTMWLASSSGVFHINANGSVKSYLATEGVGNCCIATTSNGQVLVGTTNRGLFVYNPLSDTFTQQPSTATLSISTVCSLADGSVMIGTHDNGAYILKSGDTAIKPCHYYHPQVDLREANVHCIMQDRDGAVWMGLFQKGLLMQPLQSSEAFRSIGSSQPNTNIIGQHSVLSVHADPDGTVWVGTDGDGLYHIDIHENKLIRHYPAGQKGMPATIMAIEAPLPPKGGEATSPDGKSPLGDLGANAPFRGMGGCADLFLGSWQQGGGWLDRATGEFHRFAFTETDGVANVMGFTVDAHNNLWICTGGKCLYRYDIANRTAERYGSMAAETPTTNTLPNSWLSQAQISADGRLIYICLSNGMACYDTQAKSFTSQIGANHSLNGYVLNTMRIDKQGNLWAGTDRGLLHLDAHGKIIRQYTTDDGLPHNNVASLQFDNQGQLWVGTMNGLACKRGDSFSNYYASDGLQEGEWSERAVCAVGDLIVMGGVSGISVINPAAINTVNSIAPSIQLVDAVMDQQPMPLSTMFDMPHDAGSLNLRFATMIYDRPDAVAYKYSINNADYTPLLSNDGVLSLSHLAAGSYTISVKAVVGGIESEPIVLTVVVRPPFYASVWAILLYIAILAFITWRIIVSRRQRMAHKQMLAEHIAKEQLKEDKLQFFMSLNHEIRTPMTLIAAPLQQLIDSDHDEPRQRQYSIMQRATQRILTIINQILDLRKIDRGLLQMRMRPIDLVAMTRDVCSLFEAKAVEHNITLHFDDRTGGCEVWADPDHFDKVIMNLMSNAFKFTPDGGSVGVIIERNDAEAIITVWDDGQSIVPENLNRVFERFFQEDNTVNRATAGTGIGLNLARQLVQLHHGTIEAQNLSPKALPQPSPKGEGVEDTPQTGCAFVITIPLGDAHLSESEKYVEEEPETPVESNSKAPSPGGEGRGGVYILIAEDEEEIRNYLVAELSPHYKVIACADGRQALSEALRCPPALVLSDVMMPVMDGYTLCSRLKSNTATNFVPVVLLTAKTQESDKLEGLGRGADAYIEKPFNIEIVRHTIRNLIAAHDLLRNKLSGNEVPIDRIDEVRIATPDEQLLDRVTRVVNAHIDDPHLSVEQIAQEVGISRVHLHRKMKELTNLGPRDWVRNLRLERAAQMLRQGHHNISQVMYVCGFDNQSSFSTKFKAKFGMSPTAYMQSSDKT